MSVINVSNVVMSTAKHYGVTLPDDWQNLIVLPVRAVSPLVSEQMQLDAAYSNKCIDAIYALFISLGVRAT